MNGLLEKDFKEYLEELKSPIDISFYEWSNVDAAPISFRTVKMFTDFLTKHNIAFTDKDIEFIKKEGTCHSACPKNEATLLLTKYKYELRNAINGNPVTTTRPTDNRYYPSCYPCGRYDYDDYYNQYYD